MSFKNPVGIIAANRLPIGKINGFYKKISPETLYQNLIKQQFNKASERGKLDARRQRTACCA